MLYQTWIACIMLCAFVEVPPLQVDTINWLLLITVGVIFTAAPHSLFAASLKNLSASTAGDTVPCEGLYGTFFAFLILHEQPTISTIIGGVLVISAAFYETWSVTRRTHAMMKVFTHRGASGTYPENTKSAILAAVDLAVDGIEIDVQSCLDDYMIIHDTWLDRTTSGRVK